MDVDVDAVAEDRAIEESTHIERLRAGARTVDEARRELAGRIVAAIAAGMTQLQVGRYSRVSPTTIRRIVRDSESEGLRTEDSGLSRKRASKPES
jgi:long-subunit acyl-CoA synthetase (AMP-forming)